MNFQWGDKGIGWTDATLNIVTGCLNTKAECAIAEHCYARKTAERLAGRFGYPENPNHFQPTFHPERLREPYRLQKPAKIFLSSMGELFGPWIPREWQKMVLQMVEENPQHIFQFLTKYPHNYSTLSPFMDWRWPDNAWLGTTLNNAGDARRWYDLACVRKNAKILFISAEPLLGPLDTLFGLSDLDWMIIGAQTKPTKQPKKGWVEDLVKTADTFRIPIFMKKNLAFVPRRREWPDA